ncbi:hypothetical protein HT031_004903 [Scenedesmus sp. PABB004]|nr:hypothetical protein HT031_004903 [Scenedesmus sp. PABB004]
MRPETAALAAWLGRCARASSVEALAAEGAAGAPLLGYFDGLLEDAKSSGAPCADLCVLLAAGVQKRLTQAVRRALEQLAARPAASGSLGFASMLCALCEVMYQSFMGREALGVPIAELAAEVVNAGMLPPLAAACTALAAELEAQQQQQRQGSSVEVEASCMAAVALLTAAVVVRSAWPPDGQLEGPLLPLAQPAARLALAMLRRAGAWRGDGDNSALAVAHVLAAARRTSWWTAQSVALAAQKHGHVIEEEQHALLADPAVQQLLLAELALCAAHRHEVQRGRPAGADGCVGSSDGDAPAMPARHAALLRALELDASPVPQSEHSERLVVEIISAVGSLFNVSPPTSCGGSLPQPRGAGLAAAAAEVALELVALQPTRRVLAVGTLCAATIMLRLQPASEGGAPDEPAASAAAAAVVRAFLPLARPIATALLEPEAGSSPHAAAAAASREGVDELDADRARRNAQSGLGACGVLLLLSSGAEAGSRDGRRRPARVRAARAVVLAARGVAVLAQLLSQELAPPQPAADDAAATNAGAPGEPVLLGAVVAALAAQNDTTMLLGARLRALGSLPADASRAGLERLLAQQLQLHAASAELAAELDGALADGAAAPATAQERGRPLAAQAEELCSAVALCCRCVRAATTRAARRWPARTASWRRRACQAAAWRAHKPVCRALAAAAAGRAPGAE